MLLSASLLLIAQTISPPSYWGSLTSGPHAVGFTQRWVVDSTRRLPKGELYGLRYRPVLLNLWYPTTRATGRLMRYDDYFAGAVRAAGTDRSVASYATALVAFERRIAWRELAKTERDSTPPEMTRRIEELFASRSFAYRDAPRARGAFPVVVYTQGSQSSMDDNVVLCEYLASRGYVVVGSAFPGEDNSNFMTNSSDESRPRDIRRLLLELGRLPGLTVTSVSVIGHSAGAQAALAFAADPSAPIDAVLSLDTTEDYSMLSDRLWPFTDRVMQHRTDVKMPIVFVAGPEAMFELADSLSATTRWLVTVPNLLHNDFISQGNIRRQLLAGLPNDDAKGREAAARSYRSLVEYAGAWLDAHAGHPNAPSTAEVAASPVSVTIAPIGEKFPRLGSESPRSARETRHLFSTEDPKTFAELALRARAIDADVASDDVLMMLLVDAIRRGATDRGRAMYGELVVHDSTVRRIADRIQSRAKLFERIGAPSAAEEWRSMLRALGMSP